MGYHRKNTAELNPNLPVVVHQDLYGLMEFPSEGVFSEVLVKSDHFNYALLCVSQGGEINLHNSTGDIAIQVLRGKGALQLTDREIEVYAGMFLFIPAHITQGLKATENLAILHSITH